VYGRLLTAALSAETVDRRDVPANLARQLPPVVGIGFVEVWGPIDLDSGEEQVARARYRALLTEQALAGADVSEGRVVYQRTCMACHRLYDEGGDVGPDLTGSARANLDYILERIIDPNAVIPNEYRTSLIETIDDRIITGIIKEQNENAVTIVTANETLVVSRSEIATIEQSDISMMPEGLLEGLSDQEVRDLLFYLRSPAQVPLPREG
jgi:putative heme-binding domain-containing protein